MSAPEESESKKRALSDRDGDIDDAIRNKRAALNPSESNQQPRQQRQYNHSFAVEKFHFKILCPQSITGIIIGKGGSTINQLNGSTGCSIKLSHNNEYYPGTNDRILLCHGTKESLQLAIDELVTKIAEAAEKKYPTEPRLEPYPPNRTADGLFLVRVLIPRNSEGALIGKGGVVVRQMTNDTGCNFQLGQEGDSYGTNERIFILTSATVHSIVNGAAAILHNLINSPKIRSYVNITTSYGNAPSNHMSVPQNMNMPYQQPQLGYAPAPMPGMVMVPAPGYSMPPQAVQYMQTMPPQMTVPNGGMVPVPMVMQPVAQNSYAPQQAFGQQQGQGGYNYNQGRAGNPSRHAGGPNGRGVHGGAGGGQGQSQGQSQGHRHNKYGGGGQQQGQPQGQQQGYPVQQQQQQQTAPVYQQQQGQPQAVVAAGQYPAQQPQAKGQQQGQAQVQQQYLYPSTVIPGMQQPQQQGAPVYQQQGQVQAKPAHQQQAYGVPQQQHYGQQQQVQQPYHAAATTAPQQVQSAPQGYVAAGAYPAYVDPAQGQAQVQYAQQHAVQGQGQAAAQQGYPQQQQYVQQYAVPGQAAAGAVPQQQYAAYGAPAARK